VYFDLRSIRLLNWLFVGFSRRRIWLEFLQFLPR
jgi:hypothetical protein